MKILHYIPTVLTVFMVFGILVGYYTTPKPTFIFSLLFINILLLGIIYWYVNKSYKQNYLFNFTAYFLFFLIGITAITIQNISLKKPYYNNFTSLDNHLVLTIKKQLKSTIYYHKYYSEVCQVDSYKTKGSILLNIRIDSVKNKLEIGDKILIKTNVKEINKPLNLFQFDYQNYLKKQQVHHQITIAKNEIIKLPKKEKSLHRIAFRIRENINKSLEKYHFKKDELAIINALILGQRQNISKELLQSYANAGAIHILAVSGLHIGILLILLNLLFKPLELLKNGKTVKLFLILFLLWIYAFIAGFSPSIIRAVSMFTAITIGLLSNKKTNTLHNLFISMFFLLLVNPLYLFSVGFQLSYVAVFSIIYVYPLFIAWYNPQQWLLKKIWQLLAISFSAQIGVLPISLYYFHQFPSLFFISSLVIIPLLGFILGFGILIIILAVLGVLPQFMANLFGLIIHKMNVFISFIASQESFLLQQISFSILLLIVSYIIIIFGFIFLQSPNIKKGGALLLGILFFQSALIYEKWQCQTTREFIVFNKSKKSVVINRKGKKIRVFHNLDSTNIIKNKALQDYKIENGEIEYIYNSIQNNYIINNQKVLIVDSLGVYNIPKYHPEMVLLRQSPKINLARLISILHPKIIIADASNYKSYKKQWKQTCIQHKIPYYNTSVQGAFRYLY